MCENYLELFEKSTFTENEVPLLCEAASSLILNRRFDEFEKLLFSLEASKVVVLKRNEKFLRAMIAFYYERNCYEHVINLLKSGGFSDYTGLVDIWDDVHYTQKERQIGKPLTPLIRFRTRQKFPPPKNISPSGERASKKLSEEAKSILKNWMSKNSQNPYPSQETREELASKAGLTLYQVKTWFANARRRQKINEDINRKRYELYEKNRKYLLNGNTVPRNSLQCSDIERDDIEMLFRSENNTPCTVNGAASKFVSSFRAAQLSDQNNNISVENISPKREANRCDGMTCHQNQVHSSCIQHLAQLCRNITYKNIPNPACDTKEVGGETKYSTSDIRYNYQQSYRLQGNTDRPLLFPNYQTVDPEEIDSINHLGFALTPYPENMNGHVQDNQYINQNLVHQIPNVVFAGQTNFQSSSPAVQFNQLSNHIPPQNNQGSRIFSSSCIPGSFTTSPQQSSRLPFQNFLQTCQPQGTPKFISSGTQTNYSWIPPDSYDTHGLFWSPLQNARFACWNDSKPITPARPNSCPLPATPNSCPLPATQPLVRLLCEEPSLSTNQQQSDNAKWYGEDIQLSPPQCTEEQDVAKVLLDLSSQHSSQESS